MGPALLHSSQYEKHKKDHPQFQKVLSQKEKHLMQRQAEYSEKADLIPLPITGRLRVVQVIEAIILQALILFSKT
jgi:DNA-binding protein YbaB